MRNAFSVRKILVGSWLFLALALLMFASCAGRRVAVRSAGRMQGYSKLYLAPVRSDPRGLQPRVLARLQRVGFDAVEIKIGGPPIEAQGSGFVITPEGHILTCAHVVKGQAKATVWIQGTRYVSQVVEANARLDTAILRLENVHDSFRPLSFAVDPRYRLGQEAYTMGFPLADVLGTAPRLNKGLISSTVGLGDDTNQLQVSVEVQPGNSGGPLLNARGEVIGMVAATLNPMNIMARSGGSLPQNVNFAIKAEVLKEFVASWGVFLPKTNAPATGDFEVTRRSLALVRGGVVEEKDLNQPAVLCRCLYSPAGGKEGLVIEFYDLKTGKPLLQVTAPDGGLFSSEDAVLDNMFGEISARFFPERPNPFIRN